LKQKTTKLQFWENFYKISPILLLLTLSLAISPLSAQNKIIFPATDSLPITADMYPGRINQPYVLLFHEEGSSRGEYRDIVPRLVKMGYNCMAVDLREGKENNYISNETTRRADSMHLISTKQDCLKDMEAAIKYAVNKSSKPVILFGSSFSASLCLLIANHNPAVNAVIAFSPGEFFRPRISVKDSLKDFDKLAFLTGQRNEYPYLTILAQNIPAKKLTIFVPSHNEGAHGVKALLKSDPASNEYWLSLLMFFRNIKKL